MQEESRSKRYRNFMKEMKERVEKERKQEEGMNKRNYKGDKPFTSMKKNKEKGQER